jgi:hypothetical protein
MGKDRYFRQLDPKSYRIQGQPGQLFVVWLPAAIVVAAALDGGLGERPECIRILGATAAGTAVFMVLVRALAGIGPGAARQRQLGGLAGQPAYVPARGRGGAGARARLDRNGVPALAG